MDNRLPFYRHVRLCAIFCNPCFTNSPTLQFYPSSGCTCTTFHLPLKHGTANRTFTLTCGLDSASMASLKDFLPSQAQKQQSAASSKPSEFRATPPQVVPHGDRIVRRCWQPCGDKNPRVAAGTASCPPPSGCVPLAAWGRPVARSVSVPGCTAHRLSLFFILKTIATVVRISTACL